MGPGSGFGTERNRIISKILTAFLSVRFFREKPVERFVWKSKPHG